tara:strand:- start:258 stop:560 length:303 start_codon:yes stop_codon:yes gene_type:complete
MSNNIVSYENGTTQHVWTNVRGYGNISVNSYGQSTPLSLQTAPKTNCTHFPWNRIPSETHDNFTMVDRSMAWSNPSISPWWNTDFYGWKPCPMANSPPSS